MKKLTLIIATVVMGFAFASCSGPSKDAILNEVSTFFNQAKADVQAIDNADDLLAFVNSFGDKKNEFMNALAGKFEMQDDKFVGFTEEENTEMMNKISEMATEYNNVEYAKCGEIVKPYIEKYDSVVKGMYEKFLAGEAITTEMKDQLTASIDDITKYADIVPEELANMYYADEKLVDTIFSAVTE